MNTPPPPSCPQCGATLPADAPQGLCPRCLGALNFATETLPPESVPVPPRAPLPPEEIAPHFPQLEILECLGRGGMGVVYKARQKSLHRLVALKLLAPERAEDVKFAERFEKEAQALAALSHPSIVTIHDFGQAGGFYYLLMEFVDGVNLRQAMKAGRLTPEQALAIVPPVCEALQYAHERGIVHRDIKPENLLMDKEGRVKIADFGIAKILGTPPWRGLPQSSAAQAGGAEMQQPVVAEGDEAGAAAGARSQALGTPAYAAPEQQSNPAHVDHRADIYSLGVVLYEMLTGELPPAHGLPPHGPARRVQMDVRLEEVVLRALETRPELRFSTVAEFHTRLAETGTGAAAAKTGEPASAADLLSRKQSRVSQAITPLLAAWTPPPHVLRRLGVAGVICGFLLLLGAPLFNEWVDDHGMTATARQHLARREEAQRVFAAAKETAAAKARELAEARTPLADGTPGADPQRLQQLTEESDAAQVKAFQAEANLNAAAVLKAGTEQSRIAMFYLLAGALFSAGAVTLYHLRRQRAAGMATLPEAQAALWRRHPMAAGVASVLLGWLLAAGFALWSAGPPRLPVADAVVDEMEVRFIETQGQRCVVQLSFAVAGAPVEVRPLLEGAGLPAGQAPLREQAVLGNASPAVLPGAVAAQQPHRVFTPGKHTWLVDFLLPSAERAEAAARSLRAPAPVRALRQAHRAVIFETAAADGAGPSSRGVVEFQRVPIEAAGGAGPRLAVGPWLLLALVVLTLAGAFAIAAWMIRRVFKSHSTGCIVALAVLLGLLLLGFLLPVLYVMLGKGPAPAPPANRGSVVSPSTPE